MCLPECIPSFEAALETTQATARNLGKCCSGGRLFDAKWSRHSLQGPEWTHSQTNGTDNRRNHDESVFLSFYFMITSEYSDVGWLEVVCEGTCQHLHGSRFEQIGVLSPDGFMSSGDGASENGLRRNLLRLQHHLYVSAEILGRMTRLSPAPGNVDAFVLRITGTFPK
jgi:hypothetical protein